MIAEEQTFEILPTERHVYITARLWHELYPKADPIPFGYMLHHEIDFTKYGNGISKFYFTYIIQLPENNIHEAGMCYDSHTRELELAVRIPYEDVEAASQEETVKLMEQYLLVAIDSISEIELQGEFAIDQFAEDVSVIFEKKNGTSTRSMRSSDTKMKQNSMNCGQFWCNDQRPKNHRTIRVDQPPVRSRPDAAF